MSFSRVSKTAIAPIGQSVTIGSNASKTMCKVYKRDLVKSIDGNASFTLAPIDGALSPSNSALFPWLSGIAKSFDYIEWDYVTLQFVSSSPSTSAGRLYMCADYDPADPAPGSAAQFMSQQDSVSGGVWNSFELKLSQRELKRFKRYYTKRSNTIPEPADSMPGNIYIAVDGTPVGKIGDLYIQYGVTLTVPSIDTSLENEKMLIKWVNPSAGAQFPEPNWGVGGSLANPSITTKSTDPPLIPTTTYSGLPGFKLAPRNLLSILHAVTQCYRASTGATSGFLDCFQALTAAGFPTSPAGTSGTRWKGIDYVVEDPDGTGVLTLTQSPVNKFDTPVIANSNGAAGQYFANETFMSYNYDAIPAGKRPPQIRVTAVTPQLYLDNSNFGASAGTPGANLPSVQQSTTSTLATSTAIGIKDALLYVASIIQ